MAVIIFVGVDKTGKSTLMREILRRTNRHICIDRFTPCQYVYGKLHGKKDTPSIDSLRDIERAMKKANSFFVHATADTVTIKARFAAHSETDIKWEEIDEVKDNYVEYLKKSRLPVLTIDTSELSKEECIGKILEFADLIDGGLI